MVDFKPGQRVTLTGEDWSLVEPDLHRGEVHTILNVDEDGALEFVATDGDHWDVSDPGWEVELNTDTPEEHFAKTVTAFSSEDPTVQQIKEIGKMAEALGISSFEQSVRRHTDRIATLLIEKNKQYANSALDPIRVFSKADRMEQLRVRADDKLSRIRNGDTSEDSILDLCGYLILPRIAAESE